MMSDYRYQIVEHNGIQCLHVMTEVADHAVMLENVEDGIAHAYIPIDDIKASIARYKEENPPAIEAQGETWHYRVEMLDARGKPIDETSYKQMAEGLFLD